ncbi:MAG TPA: hypothetical protein VK421_09205 [Pyrinomonadaceae bacterium]|nr:hypothetical protein [Pyrinomonadaceae bacterium]
MGRTRPTRIRCAAPATRPRWPPGAANAVTSLPVGGDTFGQTTSARRDTSTTSDTGALEY